MPQPKSSRICVVIPAFGHVPVTHAAVDDCQREAVSVLIVDNAGDYVPVADERVVRPKKNLGWLQGTNVGLKIAADSGHDLLVALNNDVRLSTGFFSGLTEAARARPNSGLIAPLYDDVVVAQRDYLGPAAGFVPMQQEDSVKLIDGTCFLVPTETYRLVGDLDARHFGRRGWGAIEDYCLRTRRAGYSVMVTRRAYLNHAKGVTANSRELAHRKYANAEFRRGMRRKWGADWRSHFDPDTVPVDTPGQPIEDLARLVEDRLGLVNTRIGRRGMGGS